MRILFILLLTASIFTQCNFSYLTKPNIKKIERLECLNSGNNYNYYQFFGNEFECQPGKNQESSMSIAFNDLDSSYRIYVGDYDSDTVQQYNYKGKYGINERGSIQLSADSPFMNNQLQILMYHGVRAQFVRFTFNDQFKEIFSLNKGSMFCEAEKYNLEECTIPIKSDIDLRVCKTDIDVNPYYVESVKQKYESQLLSSGAINSDSSTTRVTMYIRNCPEDFLIADSIQFLFVKNNGSRQSRMITIVPDSVTTFSSHIFAWSLYEGCAILKEPKNKSTQIFTVAETDVLDSLVFLNQLTDRNGQIWYYVEFTCYRPDYPAGDNEKFDGRKREKSRITGWTKRGETRLGLYNFGCYSCN